MPPRQDSVIGLVPVVFGEWPGLDVPHGYYSAARTVGVEENGVVGWRAELPLNGVQIARVTTSRETTVASMMSIFLASQLFAH